MICSGYFRTNYGECEFFSVYRRCVQFGRRLNFCLVIWRSFEGLLGEALKVYLWRVHFLGRRYLLCFMHHLRILELHFGSCGLDALVLSFDNSDSLTTYGAVSHGQRSFICSLLLTTSVWNIKVHHCFNLMHYLH